jgi:AAA family ATP:ADP antiporter
MTVAGGAAHRLLPRIERHEARRLTLAALSFICIAAGALIARAGGDALFLSHFGSGPLPLMYIAGAVATGLGTYGCIWASRRLETGHIAIVVGGLLFFANVTLFASFRAFPSFSRAGAYLLADVSVRIPVFLFWAFASEIFDARQTRRLFGVIGSAGTAACLPAGLLVGPLARKAGAESLVLLTAALMGGFIVSAAALVRDEKGHARSRRGLATGGAASARGAIGTPQLVSIGALAVMTSLVETLVDFQFKTTAASTASSTALVNIFGTLYGISSVASLLIQLLIVHRLLAVAGALASLCVLPGVLLLSQAGVFRFRSAGWVFATKALDITLTTTVNGTARQLLYRGIRRESRLTARALADGLYLPLAIGLAGAGLGAMSGSISIQAAAVAAAVGCVIWLLLARRAHTAYVSGLIDSLKARQFDFSEEMTEETLFSRNPALEAWLRDAFGSASDEDLIYLATVLPQLGRLVRPAQLKAALARDNPKVKVAILQSLSASRLKEGPALARSLSRHADPEVRRAAILAASDSTASLAGLEWLEDALADPEPRARAAAAAVFANAADAEARSLGRAHLSGIVSSEQPEFRAAAAEALEHVEDVGATDRELRTQLLVRLLQDRDASVVLAALETIRSRQDSALALPVLSLLARPVLAGAASDALVEMGPAVIDPVLSLFEGPAGSRHDAVLANVPQVLERIGDPRGLAVITRMMTPRAPEERTVVFRSYVQLLGRGRAAEAHEEEIDALVAEECLAAATRLSSVRRLGRNPAVRLARDAVSDLLACHVQNAFILLAGRVGSVDMMVLHRQITSGSGEERSNALELLENVLPKSSRDLLLGVLEPGTENGEAEPAAEVLELLSDHDSEWIVAGAAWAAAELALVSCADGLEVLKDHESPVVRETALFALERLGVAR